jgi:4-alpha-glucanotransferase
MAGIVRRNMPRDVEPNPWGIEPGYEDVAGAWHDASPSTVRSILSSMGADGDSPPAGPPVWIVRQGAHLDLAGRWELQTEDGSSTTVGGSVEAPGLGYHQLFREDDGRGVRLIVTPGRCYLPSDLSTWGWAVQLYGLRSSSSWGMGDLGDLRRFGSWSASRGAGLVLLNPLHASLPVVGAQQPSPYYPSSRCFRNPLYLRVEDVPGAVGEEVDAAVAAGRALNGSRRIDRDAVLSLKLRALRSVYDSTFKDNDAFSDFVASGGATLHRFAVHSALAEVHGADWRRWPVDFRHPTTFEVREFAKERADDVRFHAWLQWLLDGQLSAAGSTVGLMQDLAIGVDPGGADAWMWQDVLAPGISVGAPPDEYNADGQDWGLPPFDPWKLRDAAYEPFISTVRAGFRHAGGLRFDHVMGLFRLWWIPEGSSSRDGAYVRYPFSDLLDILALESVRAGAYVVGEDLGTVEEYMRSELSSRDVLSYRVLWFESSLPSSYPRKSLAAVTTHDLPTVAGVWSGAEPSMASVRARIEDWTGLDDSAPVTEVVQAVYGLLAQAPSMIVTATMEDALGVVERPNYPGTLNDTNWSLALPLPLEDIEADPRVAEVAATLDGRGR